MWLWVNQNPALQLCVHTRANLGHACIHKHTLKGPDALRIWPAAAAAAADVDNSISESMCVKLRVYSVCVNFSAAEGIIFIRNWKHMKGLIWSETAE